MEPGSQTELNRQQNSEGAAQDSAAQQQSTHESTTAAIDPKDYDGKDVLTAQGNTPKQKQGRAETIKQE
ncbi:MAG: hypothetical protein WCB49_11140 [Gammaproteobacteria bacterium]